jgi:hypothetical protein
MIAQRLPAKSHFRPVVQKCTEILTDERIPEVARFGFFMAGTVVNLALSLLSTDARDYLLFQERNMNTWFFASAKTSYIFEARDPPPPNR